MFVIIFFLLLSNLPILSMEAPLGKRKADDSETETESESNKGSCSQVSRMLTATHDSRAFLLLDLTPRITPLMIAVAHNNQGHVRFLLDEAQKRGCLKEYVNLDCGEFKNDVFEPDAEYKFFCSKKTTALHLAAKNGVSADILVALLQAGADPNIQDAGQSTPLFIALPTRFDAKIVIDNQLRKIFCLHRSGSDPKIGHPHSCPWDIIEEECKRKNMTMDLKTAYLEIKKLFGINKKNQNDNLPLACFNVSNRKQYYL